MESISVISLPLSLSVCVFGEVAENVHNYMYEYLFKTFSILQ